MLEFKNVSVRLSADRLSTPFSLEMDDGEVACLSGEAGSGKSLLLMAILGLAPLAAGYITIDGELVTPGSSAYFRHMIAYVPQRMPSLRMKVRQIFVELMALKSHSGEALSLSTLQRQWEAAGLPADFSDRWANEVEPERLREAMMVAVPQLGRPIVLVDDPSPETVRGGWLNAWAASGAEVLFASRHQDLPCHKIITL